MELEMTKMSPKGQVVIPKEIRDELGLTASSRFVVYGADDYVIFKKIELPSIDQEFKELIVEAERIAKERGITRKDIEREIRGYRKDKDAGA